MGANDVALPGELGWELDFGVVAKGFRVTCILSTALTWENARAARAPMQHWATLSLATTAQCVDSDE